MRQLLLAGMALGCLTAVLGCYSVHGRCDCDSTWGCPCYRSGIGLVGMPQGGVIVNSAPGTGPDAKT